MRFVANAQQKIVRRTKHRIFRSTQVILGAQSLQPRASVARAPHPTNHLKIPKPSRPLLHMRFLYANDRSYLSVPLLPLMTQGIQKALSLPSPLVEYSLKLSTQPVKHRTTPPK
jgi:hypothetical protein